MRRQKLDIQNKTHANLLLNKIEKMELANFQSKPSFMFKAAKYFCQSFRGFCQLFFKQCLLQYRHKKIISAKYRGKVQTRNLSVILASEGG